VGDPAQIQALGVVKWCTAQTEAHHLFRKVVHVPSFPTDVRQENKPSEKPKEA
jgi:hypothetical protein